MNYRVIHLYIIESNNVIKLSDVSCIKTAIGLIFHRPLFSNIFIDDFSRQKCFASNRGSNKKISQNKSGAGKYICQPFQEQCRSAVKTSANFTPVVQLWISGVAIKY